MCSTLFHTLITLITYHPPSFLFPLFGFHHHCLFVTPVFHFPIFPPPLSSPFLCSCVHPCLHCFFHSCAAPLLLLLPFEAINIKPVKAVLGLPLSRSLFDHHRHHGTICAMGNDHYQRLPGTHTLAHIPLRYLHWSFICRTSRMAVNGKQGKALSSSAIHWIRFQCTVLICHRFSGAATSVQVLLY